MPWVYVAEKVDKNSKIWLSTAGVCYALKLQVESEGSSVEWQSRQGAVFDRNLTQLSLGSRQKNLDFF